MIQMVSDRFLRCDFCGGAIRPKDIYFWDEDEDLNKCYACDEAEWESMVESLDQSDKKIWRRGAGGSRSAPTHRWVGRLNRLPAAAFPRGERSDYIKLKKRRFSI
jgi:hypothetical protein